MKINKKEFYRRVRNIERDVFKEIEKVKKVPLTRLPDLIGMVAIRYFPNLKHKRARGYFKYIYRMVLKSGKVRVEKGYVIWVGE